MASDTGQLFERIEPSEVAEALGAEEIPMTRDLAITRFLNRWAFNWRGERAVIEKELRELIADFGVGER
jgi:hypothetical protein